MSSKSLSRMPSNPMHAPPTYEEMGKPTPKKEGRNSRSPLPIRLVLCDRCKQPGGKGKTFISIGGGKYRHVDCFKDGEIS